MRARPALFLVPALLIVIAPHVFYAQNCGITIASQPTTVNFPYGTLPSGGSTTFGEIPNVNYSAAYLNRTITIQYQNGSS